MKFTAQRRWKKSSEQVFDDKLDTAAAQDEDGVCTVFGDPHYRTFDGNSYSFQGACRYILTTDCSPDAPSCEDGSFSVIVQNDARLSPYSWTQNVTFSLYNQITGFYSIKLLQGLRIEVNGLPLLLPYSGNGVNIFEQKHKLRLTTRVGISILWDGRSMLEITAKPELKNSLFGLCGNFDGDARNDFNSSTGNVMLDSNEFAQSWKIPGEGFCSIQSPSRRSIESCQAQPISIQFAAHNECQIFKSPSFQNCFPLVSPQFFHRSCLSDACARSCPDKAKCGCDSMRAYVSECAKKGLKIHWKEHQYCNIQCTSGKIYSECGTSKCRRCKKYWADRNGLESCTAKRCRPGCYCPEGKIEYKGVCIKPKRCPSRYKFQGVIFFDGRPFYQLDSRKSQNSVFDLSRRKSSSRRKKKRKRKKSRKSRPVLRD
ncbi:Oidioi.mRNA.OKI2018_I69.PAR.g10607.t1.cds [Oikopleura dioica]|uniref:Oidioi.mRNA.OKI2018_I69.PAR.g10607.t1.cds n=1 Tax=Oikopleura dioica TaxID=34765 RepID=A0ABN7RSA0_OIKDI|nr:Oidioi.mRNA.OKI2018_I69.PAR.g10607.t1.cds [Oikopleura dioica]